jgi:hypothetical protein
LQLVGFVVRWRSNMLADAGYRGMVSVPNGGALDLAADDA